MQIQRIQSVYLFLAAIILAVFTFLPVVGLQTAKGVQTLGALEVCGVTTPMLLFLCLDVLLVVLLLITLFKYRSLSFQMILCKVNILLIASLLLSIAITAFMHREQAAVSFSWTIALPFVAMVLVILAHRGISHDKKLLTSSDRLR